MAAGGWVSLINWASPEQEGAGTTLENTEALTNISPLQRALPANWLAKGTAFRWTAYGIYSTTGTPTLIIGLYYGGVAGTALAASAATTTGSAVSNLTWRFEGTGRVVATGESSTSLKIASMGIVHGIAATASTPVLVPVSSATGNTVESLDPTTNKGITIGAKWGAASTSDKITCYQFLFETLN